MDMCHQLQREIRKYENAMVVNGLAVIAFGIWTIIKSGLVLLMTPDSFKAQMGWSELSEYIAEMDSVTIVVTAVVVVVIVGLIMALDLALRVKVGLAARREGMGGKKMSRASIILAGVLMALLILSVVSGAIQIGREGIGEDTDTRLIAIMIDLTALLACLQLMYAVFRVRRLRKELSAEGTGMAEI